MTILKSLTIKNLKLNKKRTIVTIIGIMLATALIVALSSLVLSFKASIIEYQKKNSGDYHYEFRNIPKDEIKYITNNRNVEKAYITVNIGYANLENSKNEYKPYLCLKGFSKEAFSNLSINLIEGRLPENENEILISNHIKTDARVKYKVGDNITLNIGDRISEGYKLNQSNPYNKEIEEHIEERFTKTYTVVGIIERPINGIEQYSAPGYTIITYLDENNINKDADIYVRYTKEALKNQYKTTADILGMDEETVKKYMLGESGNTDEIKYDFISNGYLISYETLDFSDSLLSTIYWLSGIITGIIIITSVFCIKNSFSISITEKVKQYGMLASVGATSKQIKKNVYFESIVLAIIGIPLGIALGLLASFILIKVCNILMSDFLNLELMYKFSIVSILLSLILSAITCLLSARSSAKKASKISPIDAIRESADIKIKSKKVKSPKFIKSIFGVGGDIAYKNLKRNNKKYRTTVISIVVCVAVFIATSSFVDLAFRAVKIEMNELDYNISVRADIEKLEAISNFENINKCTIQRNMTIKTDSLKYNSEYQDRFKSGSEEKYPEVYSIGKEEYNRYINEIGLNYEYCKDKAILINTIVTYKYDEEGKSKKSEIEIYNNKKGDAITGEIVTSYNSGNSTKPINFEIGAVTTKRPMALNLYLGDGILIVSDEFIDKYKEDLRDYTAIYIDSSNADKLQEDIEEYLINEDNYYINNVNQDMKAMQSLFTLIAIFLYGFIIVIALIGITNIFNTITTSMELRAKEFAMLKSVGMTKKEFNKMIKLESLFYGIKSLIIGIPIGIGLSYLIFKAIMQSYEFSYKLPVNGIVISLVAVFLLIWSIMKFSLSKINKQNIIETIRRDNI